MVLMVIDEAELRLFVLPGFVTMKPLNKLAEDSAGSFLKPAFPAKQRLLETHFQPRTF